MNGIKTVWIEENNFRIQSVIAFFVLAFVFYMEFSLFEKAFVVLAIVLVLAGEMINTTIEDLCNKIEPNHDDFIGKIKDISSGFVLLSSIGAFIIGAIVFVSHFS